VDAEVVVILAADLPWIAPAIPRLLASLTDDRAADVAVVVDSAGRRNHLAAAWRRHALSSALDRVTCVDGAAARSLFVGAHVLEVADLAGDASDCDTWDDIEHARQRAGSREIP
jgi:CTP:molybdopterin cytidylyltransferase MocA